jgi:hypothetical protein
VIMSIPGITSVLNTCDLHDASLRLEVAVMQLCKRALSLTVFDEQPVSTYRISPLRLGTEHHQSLLSL